MSLQEKIDKLEDRRADLEDQVAELTEIVYGRDKEDLFTLDDFTEYLNYTQPEVQVLSESFEAGNLLAAVNLDALEYEYEKYLDSIDIADLIEGYSDKLISLHAAKVDLQGVELALERAYDALDAAEDTPVSSSIEEEPEEEPETTMLTMDSLTDMIREIVIEELEKQNGNTV